MKNKKRIWNKHELTIAYYIAKWGYYGIKTTEDNLVYHTIGDTTLKSFRMQVAKFRFLLGLEKAEFCNPSKNAKDVTKELKDKTVSQVRIIIADYIESKK